VSSSEARWAESFPTAGEIALDDFEMAADGTAMFAKYRENTRAFVRSPVALGANAWRDVSHAGTVSYALCTGGAVDVILGDGDLLTLTEDTPTGKHTLLTRVPIGDLWCLGHKDGRVVGIRRMPAGTFERIVIEKEGVTVDSPVLDGSGAADPTGACGSRNARPRVSGRPAPDGHYNSSFRFAKSRLPQPDATPHTPARRAAHPQRPRALTHSAAVRVRTIVGEARRETFVRQATMGMHERRRSRRRRLNNLDGPLPSSSDKLRDTR
jgi:hypothetical protein